MKIHAIALTGSAYERGHAHGVQLRERITAHLDAWLRNLLKPPVSDAQAYVESMLAQTDFLPAIRAHTPELLEEIDGIADGAQLPRRLVFALQLLDEEWTHRAALDRLGSPDKCSSLAVVSDDGLTWLAQNMDLGVYTDGHQCLLRLDPDDEGGASTIFSLAGMIGLMGVSSRGLGVCVNALPQLESSSTGLPVAFVIRRLLRCATLIEAAHVIATLPHATNQHYLLAETGAARSFEAGPQGVTEYRPASDKRFFHTNHPLAEAPNSPNTSSIPENSRVRLGALTTRLTQGQIGLRAIRGALSSFDDPLHPVCRLRREDSDQRGFTTGSMIAALRSPHARTLAWFSAGPPVLGGYSRHAL